MLPRVVLHTAVSVDGRTDGISPDIGLFYRLATVFHEDATLAGSETILAAVPHPDDLSRPSDTPREREGPLLVVPDSRGRVRCWRQLLSESYWRAGISLVTEETPADHLAYLRQVGVQTIRAGIHRVDLRAALEELSTWYDVKVVRVDSGGGLNGTLLRAGLVSEVSLLVCPVLVRGGSSPRPFLGSSVPTLPEAFLPLRLLGVETLEDGLIWLRYEVGPN